MESQIQSAQRTTAGSEQLMEKTADGLYLQEISYYVENDAISYLICGSFCQCDVTSPQDVSFLLALQSEHIKSYCK